MLISYINAVCMASNGIDMNIRARKDYKKIKKTIDFEFTLSSRIEIAARNDLKSKKIIKRIEDNYYEYRKLDKTDIELTCLY